MKVLLYFENAKAIKNSGVGRAFHLQKKALKLAGDVDIVFDIEDDFDVLHINTIFLKSKKMIKEARRRGKPVIYHAHTTYEDFRNSFKFSNLLAPLLKRRITKLYSQADIILTPTPYSKSLLQKYGITKPIFDISNGTDLTRFADRKIPRKMVDENFNISYSDKIVVSVGLWIQRKGILDFVEVASRLPQYKFIWVGSTPRKLVPRKILKVIDNPPPNVIFSGYIDDDILESIFINADAFFFPSYEENEGIVILEAATSKQNIIARDIPVYKPWLKNKENCYLGTNNQQFASLIEGVIEKELPSTREAAYKIAEERDLNIVGKQLKEYYQMAIDSKK